MCAINVHTNSNVYLHIYTLFVSRKCDGTVASSVVMTGWSRQNARTNQS